MVRYDDRFWGVLGGTVNEAQGSLDEDREYRPLAMPGLTAQTAVGALAPAQHASTASTT